MPLLNELAQTYLTACDVEGKARSTIRGYRESLVLSELRVGPECSLVHLRRGAAR